MRGIAAPLLAAAAFAGLWSAAGRAAPLVERSSVFAAIRFDPSRAGPEANRRELGQWVRQAAAAGARYIVLPELAVTGAATRDASEPVPGPSTRHFAELARELKLWIALSVAERAEGAGSGHYVTSLLLDSRGAIAQRRRRVMPGGSGEPDGALRGSSWQVLDSTDADGHRIGVLSGSDLRAGVPRLADRGAQTILVTAAFRTGDSSDGFDLCRELSRRYEVNLVVANRAAADGSGLPSAFFLRDGAERMAPQTGGSPVTIASLAAARPAIFPSVLGLPDVPAPVSRPATPELVSIGRRLFEDPGLSRDGSVSCASCHVPERAFQNNLPRGVGVEQASASRNVPSLLNVAYRARLGWDGFAGSLENQAKYPMSHAREMDFPYLDDALAYVRSQPHYTGVLRAAFGTDRVEFEHVAAALSAYQRTLVSGGSRFDRAFFAGDADALDPAARRGLELFRGRAGCADCHLIGERYALFMDNHSHNTGVGFDRETGSFADPGEGRLAAPERMGRFLTPSLRDVARTAPYMHDGSFATLRKVVDHYDAGGRRNPFLDPRIRPLGLSERDKRDLVAFLTALTSGDAAVPARRADGGGDAPSPALAAAIVAAPRADGAAGEMLTGPIETAAAGGADLVVLPEFAQTGPLAAQASAEELRSLAAQRWPESLRTLGRLARRHALWIAAPLLEYAAGEGLFHTMVLIDPSGELRARQRKLSARPERGDGPTQAADLASLQVALTPFGRVGLLSGDDVERGLPRLAELGAELVLVAASWESADGIDWEASSARLAVEHGIRLVIARLPGPRERDRDRVVLTEVPRRGRDGQVPLGLPPLPRPRGASPSRELAALGEELFFDPNLSSDARTSCASCHVPELAFADGLASPTGAHQRRGRTNTPSVLNSVFRPRLFWDGRALTLESQVKHALLGWAELDGSIDGALSYVRSVPEYRRAFRRLTGRGSISFDDLAHTIAAYERTLLCGDSPFDRWYFGSDPEAIGDPAKRGYRVFSGEAGCTACHTVGTDHALFSDHRLHNTGIGYHERFEYLGYGGDGLEGNVATHNRFRGRYVTPSLRNVARTAPYMHDGSLDSLADVVDFYDGGGRANPELDPLIRPLHLSPGDRESLVAFLETLSCDGASERIAGTGARRE